MTITVDYGGLTQLDVTDKEYREDAVDHWAEREADCAFCDEPAEVRLAITSYIN